MFPWPKLKMLLIWLEFTLHSFILVTWKSNEGQTILWNYSIAMWFLHSLCIVLYITVIICICTVPMARSHILVVPENPLEIPQSWDIQFRDLEKVSDLVERSKECVNRLSSPYRGAQSPVIYQFAGHCLGNTLVFSIIKFQMCGIFQ